MRRAQDRSRRQIVIINQAANYLTVGFANDFAKRADSVTLITGGVHVQGEELSDDVKVDRINRWYESPVKKKAVSYALALGWTWGKLMTKYRDHEVLFVSVPPMGYLLNLVLPHPFSMVIWDVYPDTLKISGMREDHPVFKVWSALNRRSFRGAHRLFTISEPMAEMLERYVERDKLVVHPIWSIFQQNERIPKDDNPFLKEHGLDDKFVVQYSGNVGLTHNVDALVEVAARLQDHEDIVFQIIGRGPRMAHIQRLVREQGLANVQTLPFQSDEMFPASLSAADLGVVMLHESVSRGSVPSKAYNLMSFGVPSLYIAGDDSELARYVERFGHAARFTADQLDEVAAFIVDLAADPARHRQMQSNAEQAAKSFRRSNAMRFVEGYFAEQAGEG